MTELLAKARDGRTNAVAGLPSNSEQFSDAQLTTRPILECYTDEIPFISKHAQGQASSWI